VAKKRKLLAARGISRVRASESGLPVSIDSAHASFSRSRSIKSAIRSRNFDRSAADFLDQSTNAFSAAATAASTSRASLSATCEYGFPVAGSILSRYFPPTGSTSWPSMKFWICGNSVRTPEFKRSIRLRQPAAQTKGESRGYGMARVSTSNSETHFKDEHG
jgi:hypothetical protein